MVTMYTVLQTRTIEKPYPIGPIIPSQPTQGSNSLPLPKLESVLLKIGKHYSSCRVVKHEHRLSMHYQHPCTPLCHFKLLILHHQFSKGQWAHQAITFSHQHCSVLLPWLHSTSSILPCFSPPSGL